MTDKDSKTETKKPQRGTPTPTTTARKPRPPQRATLIRGPRGTPQAGVENYRRILVQDDEWRGCLGYDTFTQRMLFVKSCPIAKEGKEWTPTDLGRFRAWVQDIYGICPSRLDALDAVLIVAEDNSFSSALAWLQNLPAWNGIERIDKLFIDYFHAPDTEHNRMAGRFFLMSVVARILEPGCKVQYAPVLEGLQGTKKSHGISALCPKFEWFTDAKIDPGDEKKSGEKLQGKLIVELGELASLSNAEADDIKRFMTSQADRYRAAYAPGASAQDYPRQCVFIGTINGDEYFKDHTGNRRFWPVETDGNIDINGIEKDREQLFAEAYTRILQKERYWPETEHEKNVFSTKQESRFAVDSEGLREQLERALRLRNSTFCSMGDCYEFLELDVPKMNRVQDRKIAGVLYSLGWKRDRHQIRLDHKKVRLYRAPDGFYPPAPQK